MSDFDFVAANDDPAADFLAREQSALGDLDDDFAFKDGGGQVKQEEPFDSQETKMNGDFTNGDEPQPSNGDLVDELTNEIADLNTNKEPEPDNSKPLISQPILPPEEPESIKKWREDHRRALEEKDAQEEKKIAELKQQGKKELDEWYARYEEQLQKTKQQNRNAEKEWLAERDNEAPGQAWEKISRLCDFNPKTSRNTKDTTKMKSMLLQLKQNPPASSAQQVSS